MFKELMERINFWLTDDRIGPDMPLTHIRLYFPSLMKKLCQEKFKAFGEGSEFRPGAYAIGCSKISIGKRVIIRPGCVFGTDTRPGGAGIVIEDDVLMGPGIHFYCHNHEFEDPNVPIVDQGYMESKQITLKAGCWLGANVILLRGVTVGSHSVVAAGSVVTKDIPEGVVAGGNPAKILRKVGDKLKNKVDLRK